MTWVAWMLSTAIRSTTWLCEHSHLSFRICREGHPLKSHLGAATSSWRTMCSDKRWGNVKTCGRSMLLLWVAGKSESKEGGVSVAAGKRRCQAQKPDQTADCQVTGFEGCQKSAAVCDGKAAWPETVARLPNVLGLASSEMQGVRYLLLGLVLCFPTPGARAG